MHQSEVDQLLRPLERFREIRRDVRALGDRLCDLSYANFQGEIPGVVRKTMEDALRKASVSELQYAPFGGRSTVRRSVADGLAARFEFPFTHDDVVLTPGAMAGLRVALGAVGSPGDQVLLPLPCWVDYPLYVRDAGLVPVTEPFSPTGDFRLDPEALARSIGPRTCALLLSQPCNPTGISQDRSTWDRLASVLDEAAGRLGREITVISDETHRDYVTAVPFQSPLQTWPRTLTVYSYGKYHRIQGQRAGYTAVSPRHPDRRRISRALERSCRIQGYAGPSALMQLAIPELEKLEHRDAGIATWRSRYEEELREAGYQVVSPSRTFFLYASTPEGVDDFEFAEELARKRVLVLPAPVFHHRGYFRIALTAAPAKLDEGLSVLVRAARRHAAGADLPAREGRAP